MWTICITFQRRRFCIHIPELLPADWLRPKPQTNPWITGELQPELAHDLSVLATLDLVAEQLSPQRRSSVQTAIRGAVTSRNLPADVTLNTGSA